MRPRSALELVAVVIAALAAAFVALYSAERAEREPREAPIELAAPVQIAAESSVSEAVVASVTEREPAELDRQQSVETEVAREPAPSSEEQRDGPSDDGPGNDRTTPYAILAGRVIDSQGRPVVGAELFAIPATKVVQVDHGSRGVRVAKTDENGAFSSDGIPGGAWRLRIVSSEHPDHVAEGTAEPGATVDDLVFVLPDGAEIRGRVVGAPAEVLESLWVRATSLARSTGRGERQPLPPPPRWARCAPDGSFVLRGLLPGGIATVSGHDDEGESYERPLTNVVEAEAGSAGVELVYAAPTVLVGHVVDARTLAPVTVFEARIGMTALVPILGPDGRAQHDFPDGRLRTGNLLPLDPQQLSIAAYGYADLRVEVHPIEGRELDLGLLRLEPARMVEVRVLDYSTGLPVARALVSLAEVQETPWSKLRTDEQGRVRLNSFPGKTARLRVLHEAYVPYESELLSLPEDDDLQEDVRLISRRR